ncbi:hypothetical protein C5167_023358 [Papaver somniferum]|uniref:Uncharacterized protein n=1 Tax=Papaver somniferum TaxID=3469 RepID=A0A4Y7JNG4_PAPSO|nr:hypothetical protein C5167_023358 [Papaver somniferum]
MGTGPVVDLLVGSAAGGTAVVFTYPSELALAKLAYQVMANALRGQENENSQEALRVLDIVLRQHAAKQGCLLVPQSFFHNEPWNFVELGGGVLGCKGLSERLKFKDQGWVTGLNELACRKQTSVSWYLNNDTQRHCPLSKDLHLWKNQGKNPGSV